MGCLPSESGRNIGSPSSEEHGMIMHSRYDNAPSPAFLTAGLLRRLATTGDEKCGFSIVPGQRSRDSNPIRSFTRPEGIEGVDRIEP